MTSRAPRLVRVASVVAIGIAAVAALAGCSSSNTAKAPETVYSAWVSNGTIANVHYKLKNDSGATKTYTNTLSRATWSLSLDGGAKPTVTVKPSAGGTAHCLISAPGKKTVLAEESAAAGSSVTCSASR